MDLALQSDPLTQNRYAFAGGNPVSRIEFDGHCAFNASYRKTYGYACNGTPGGGYRPQPSNNSKGIGSGATDGRGFFTEERQAVREAVIGSEGLSLIGEKTTRQSFRKTVRNPNTDLLTLRGIQHAVEWLVRFLRDW